MTALKAATELQRYAKTVVKAIDTKPGHMSAHIRQRGARSGVFSTQTVRDEKSELCHCAKQDRKFGDINMD